MLRKRVERKGAVSQTWEERARSPSKAPMRKAERYLGTWVHGGRIDPTPRPSGDFSGHYVGLSVACSLDAVSHSLPRYLSSDLWELPSRSTFSSIQSPARTTNPSSEIPFSIAVSPAPPHSPLPSTTFPLERRHGLRSSIREMASAAPVAACVHPHKPLRLAANPGCCRQEAAGCY